MSSQRWTAIVVVTLAVVTSAVGGAVIRSRSNADRPVSAGAPPRCGDWGLRGAGPLGSGRRVPVGMAVRYLAGVGAPWVPSSGPAAMSEITEAWLDTRNRGVALVFRDEIELISMPDDRPHWMYLQHVVQSSGPKQRFAGVRGMSVPVGEAGPCHPSVVSWMEGGYLVELYGRAAQPVADLIAVADSLIRPLPPGTSWPSGTTSQNG